MCTFKSIFRRVVALRLMLTATLPSALALLLVWLLSGNLLAVQAASFMPSPAGTITATTTIQAAVNAAISGDTIIIPAGMYTENVNITGKVLTFIGAGTGNTIVDGGGTDRVFNSDSDIVLSDLTLQRGNGAGGGLYTTSALRLTNVAILSNTGITARGGGAYAEGAVTLSGGLFQNNACMGNDGMGGGLYAGGNLTLTGTQFISNMATYHGSGAFASGTATLSGGLFQNNSSTGGSGGGLYAGDTLILTGTQFINNTVMGVGSAGGGAYANSAATVSGGLFQNNTCAGSECYGGGLYAYNDALTVTGTQFINNTASDGGGVYLNVSSTPVRVVNTLFARNTASTHGSALYLGSTGAVQILHSTIASGSMPASEAAIYVSAGTVGVINTIVASYTTSIQQSGGTLNEDYNLFFLGNEPDKSATVGRGTHDLSGDPHFVNSAGDNYHLTACSPAIDRGQDVGVVADLDGNPRPVGAGFDIGSYEYQSASGCVLKVFAIGDGVVTPTAGTYTYTYGVMVPLTASAHTGSTFTGWSGDLSGNANPITLTMDANKMITATFTLPYRIFLPVVIK